MAYTMRLAEIVKAFEDPVVLHGRRIGEETVHQQVKNTKTMREHGLPHRFISFI